jgi:DNA-binding response OmpR family regulator
MATILIVEDHVNIAATIARCVESAGHTCHIAHSGESGFRAFQDLQPDVIILDLSLPDIDGIEVCINIRRAQVVAKIPFILMLTARYTEEDRILGYSSGADAYMTKPFSPMELIVRIDALLRREQQRTELISG